MKKSAFMSILALAALLAAGCVSSTTGPPPPDPDEDDAAEYNYQLGARYYGNKSYELARDRLERAIELDPKLAKAHMTLGMVYEALDNNRLATQSYRNAIRSAPRDFNIQNAYAVFLCRQEDYDEASKYFKRASNHPENDDAEVTLTNAGLCMAQKPDTEAAEQFYRAALERKATYGEALLQLCLLKYQQEDYLHARAFLQRFMSANVTTAGVLYLASEIERKLGNERGRDEFVNQLLRDFPESPEARRALGSG
ncbi:MAG: type IV pilus biogenesis/stability protein PilW [Woeseiaceae bacterium]